MITRNHNNQYNLLMDMQKAGFNLVTCGDCGEISIVLTGQNEHRCAHCDMISDLSDFPDLYMEAKPEKREMTFREKLIWLSKQKDAEAILFKNRDQESDGIIESSTHYWSFENANTVSPWRPIPAVDLTEKQIYESGE